MDDTVQLKPQPKTDIAPQVSVQPQPVNVGIQTAQPSSSASSVPQVSQVVPSMKPEHEPLGSFVKHSEAEPILPPEVSEQGVEVVNQHVPNLSQEVKDAGMVHAKETIAPNLNPLTTLPLTKEEEAIGLKGDKSNSLYGLAMLVQKLRKVLGI